MDSAFGALAHRLRRDLLVMLRRTPMTAGELAEALGLPGPTLSGHLNVLKAVDLIYGERHGTGITYHLNLSVLEETVLSMMNLFDLDRAAQRESRTEGGNDE